MWFLQPGMNLEYALITIAASFFVILVIMPFHELSHNFVAYKCGDTSIKSYGELSLNLLEHIDIFGALSILLFGMSWSKLVMMPRVNRNHVRLFVSLTYLAGPLFNILSSVVIGVISNLIFSISFLPMHFLKIVYSFFHTVMIISLRIAVFNLIPVPNLDGFGVIATFLPIDLLRKINMHKGKISFWFMILLLLGVFSVPVSAITLKIYLFIIKIIGSPVVY